MRTLTAALLAQQPKSLGLPAAQILIDDRYIGVFRPRWTLLQSDSNPDGPTAACPTYATETAIRVRTNPATGVLYGQKITTPLTAAGWAGWYQIDSGISTDAQVSLAFDGLTIQAVLYVMADERTIKCRQSTDNGATWSAAVTVTTLTAGHTCHSLAASLNSGSEQLTLFYADESTGSVTIYTTTRAEAGGAWSAPAACSPSITTLNGLAVDGIWTDFRIVAAIDNSLCFFQFSATTPNTWGDPVAVLRSDSSTISYRRPWIAYGFGQHYYVYFLEIDAVNSTCVPYHLFTPDWHDLGLFPRPYNITTSYTPAVFSDLTHHYLCTSHSVYTSTRWTHAAPQRIDVSADLLSLKLTEDTSAPGKLQISLRNNDGRYASELGLTTYQAIKRGSQISTRLGYTISGAAEVSYYRAFWITSITHHRTQSECTLEIEAVDGWGILASTHARQALTWSGESLGSVLTAILAGVGFDVTTDANATWSDTITTFIVTPGVSLASAVQRLLTIAGGALRFWTDPDWETRFPSASALLYVPSSISLYTFGSSHPIKGLDLTINLQDATHTIALSDSVRGEAFDWSTIDILNADRIDTTIDQRLSTVAAAVGLSAHTLTQIQRKAQAARAVVPPHAGIETGDVVTIVDALTATNADYQVLTNSILLENQKGTYLQTLTLGTVP